MSAEQGKTKTITLLLSSAGRRVELLRHFRRDAEALGLDLRIVASDLQAPWSAACQDADACHVVPRVDDPAFIEETLAICERHGVDLVVPTIDPELLPLATHKAAFVAGGTDVLVSSRDTAHTARDKLQTARFFEKSDIPVPRSAEPAEVLAAPEAWTGPVILKPRGGSSSIGLKRLPSVAALAEENIPDGYVAQELLRGDEYTISLYFGPDGEPGCVIPHLRREVRSGEVSKGVTRRHDELEAVSWKVGKALAGARGPLCIQAIVTPEGRIGVFEVNARFGGGFPLAHAAGATFTRWILEELAGLPSTVNNDWQADLAMLRYDAAVFIEDPKP
ncbi:MAG: ATP-grasp domain-containing protein [Alphaproteobacteria bacterium]|nr:ATP-grasp domain-containing protein [Alphaproteobacteria bacterium]